MALERTDYYTIETDVGERQEGFFNTGTVHIEPKYDDPQFGEDVMKEIKENQEIRKKLDSKNIKFDELEVVMTNCIALDEKARQYDDLMPKMKKLEQIRYDIQTELNNSNTKFNKLNSEIIEYINQLKRGPTWTIAESLASMIGYKINYE